MKTVTRVVLMYVLAGPIIPAYGQITITASDVSTQFALGNTLSQHTDNVTTSINVGSPGSSAWDFSALQIQSSILLTSVDPATTPFISQFPGATHALRAPVTIQGISGTLYQYLTLGANLLNPGNSGIATPFVGVTLILRTTNSPSDITYALPSTLGTTWTSSFTNTQVILLNSSEISRTVKGHAATYHIDGFGPMTLPGGATYDALRIRKIDVIDGVPVLSYIFLAANAASVIVTACDTSAISGVISLCGSTTWSGPVTTDVRASDEIPEEFSLLQNYPNPFNPATKIMYTVAQRGRVSLKVYNMVGQEVAVLVNEEKSPGTFVVDWNADGMPSGVYFARMQSGSFIGATKMLLVK